MKSLLLTSPFTNCTNKTTNTLAQSTPRNSIYKSTSLLLKFIQYFFRLIKTIKKMGLVFGKISVETPKYNVIQSSPEYEIREYPPSVSAEITYDPSEFKGNKDGGFKVLAEYIGVFGAPKNTKPEKIAMTSPVITKSSEKIEMTTPVLTKDGGGTSRMVTMQFLLPSKYTSAEEAPKPTDERIVIKEEGTRKYGVVTFKGLATDEVVMEKVEKLKSGLEKDGFRIVGDFVLARFNPPWAISRFKTNEVMIPVE